MRDTESVIGRAETCVRCHVGSRDADALVRDVNHDLIAAGHPPLRFDLPSYSAALPTHWDRHSQTERRFGESAVRTGRVARLVQLAAAAELSADRADAVGSDPAVPWPELSDYDCFACHQSLVARPPRRSLLKISLGLPIWNAWHTAGQIELYGRRATLETLSPHRSDPRQMSPIGRRVADRFRGLADQASAAPVPDPRQTLTEIVAAARQRAPYDWHEAAVIYLRLRAVASDLAEPTESPAEPPSRAESLATLLDRLKQQLRFRGVQPSEAGPQSPAGFQPQRFQSTLIETLSTTSP